MATATGAVIGLTCAAGLDGTAKTISVLVEFGTVKDLSEKFSGRGADSGFGIGKATTA
ncbi:hypothetical protein FACS1894204_04530 [Synergistales bacterium]|nr:hypothetical protein FACS1894204_04530 [Synergistales bacterium]